MLEQELALVESLKELLRLHDEMVLGIEGVTAKIVKTEASRSANKFEQVAEQRIILEERQVLSCPVLYGTAPFLIVTCLLLSRRVSRPSTRASSISRSPAAPGSAPPPCASSRPSSQPHT